MAHAGEELAFGAIGIFRGLVCICKGLTGFLFPFFQIGHILDGKQNADRDVAFPFQTEDGGILPVFAVQLIRYSYRR